MSRSWGLSRMEPDAVTQAANEVPHHFTIQFGMQSCRMSHGRYKAFTIGRNLNFSSRKYFFHPEIYISVE